MSAPGARDVIAVIPARFGSTRFPGKPLVKILGTELIVHVIRAVQKSKLLSQVIVATDDERILRLAEDSGAKGVMTPQNIASGTDRVWLAAQEFRESIILNVQGDEPLISDAVIDQLSQCLLENPAIQMATMAHEISPQELTSPNSVKVILNQNDEAIYFSRFPIPYSKQTSQAQGLAWKHVGLYGFRRPFLQKFCQTPVTELELAESLEQLRALYLGEKIKVLKTKYKSWGVDIPEDIEKIEKLLRGPT